MGETERKIDEIHEAIYTMKPILDRVETGQEAMDARMRAGEVRTAEHGVMIGRLQDDVDGLGRKVRAVETRSPGAPALAAESRWGAMADFLGAIPAYWHFLGYAAAGILSLFAIVKRHTP